MAQNTGNAAETAAPEVEPTSTNTIGEEEISDFFTALDSSVNSILADSSDNQTTASSSNNTQPVERHPDEQSQGENFQHEAENLSKRYSDSSREAKRLNNRLGELEPYVPILDAMRQDPNLVSHVKDYFEGGGVAPTSMKERLELPEDFVFDPDEAFSEGKSDSAKLMNATIDGIVQRRLATANRQMSEDNQRVAEEREFRQTHDMSNEEWDNFVDYAKNHKLGLDDIFYLKNRSGRDQKIAENAGRQVTEQMRSVQQRPGSLATVGSTESEISEDDRVFDMLTGVDSGLDQLTG
jgi:hypothetical protein